MIALVDFNKGELVHQIVNFGFQRLDDVGADEEVRRVEVLQDKLLAEGFGVVKVEEELLHLRVTGHDDAGEDLHHC